MFVGDNDLYSKNIITLDKFEGLSLAPDGDQYFVNDVSWTSILGKRKLLE